MGRLFSTTGMKIYIGGAKDFTGTAFTASDFSSESWTEIKGHTNLGQIAQAHDVQKSARIGEGRYRKAKGVVDEGSMQITGDLDLTDAGQLAVAAASANQDTYSIKVEFNDAPSGGTPSIRYFAALVVNFTEGYDNDYRKFSFGLEVDSNTVRVAAAEGSG